MTPTMSEYFDAWKNSRFVAGDKARRRRSSPPRACRTSPTSSAASSCLRQRPAEHRRGRRRRRPTQTEARPRASCTTFAARLRDEEAGGKQFTAEDADTLGSEAQDAGRGDRRPGLAGRRPAGHQAGDLSRRARLAVALVAARPLAASRARPAPRAAAAADAAVAAARSASRDGLFDAQTELILGDRARGAAAARARARAPTAATLRRAACATRRAGGRRRRRARAAAAPRARPPRGDDARRSPPPAARSAPRCSAAPTR